MRNVFAALFSLTILAWWSAPSLIGAPAIDDKAQQVLDQARTAIGGPKLDALRSLALSGTIRRRFADREMSGDLEIQALFPDKFLRKETFERPDGLPGPTLVTAINGTEVWRDMVGGGGGFIMMRRPGGGGGPANSAFQGPRNDGGIVRAEFSRTLVGLLPGSIAALPLDYTYVGTAQAEDGQADVLDLKGDAGFAARLFLDSSSHLPVLLTYQGIEPRIRMGGPGGPAGRGSPRDQEARRRIEEERQHAQSEAIAPPPPPVEMALHFADHRAVDGLMFPQRISRSVQGEVREEWELTKINVNPSLKPEEFVNKKKRSSQ